MGQGVDVGTVKQGVDVGALGHDIDAGASTVGQIMKQAASELRSHVCPQRSSGKHFMAHVQTLG